MQTLGRVLQELSGFVWGPVLLCALLAAGVWFTVRTGGFQLRHIGLWWRATGAQFFKKRQNAAAGNITVTQSAATALAGTLGTGNIAGVATAIALGGPGAVFWMWVSAFFGMMTAYAENLLGVLYRRKAQNGRFVGGAYMYIEQALGSRKWGGLFAFFCVLSSFGMGNMTQANSAACAANAIAAHFGVTGSVNTQKSIAVACGALLMLSVAPIIFGGLTRVAALTEKLIPFLAVTYIIAGGAVVLANHQALPQVWDAIFAGAFGLRPAAAGAGGYLLADAVKYGVARGVFSNEAGLGSAVAVHAAADVQDPVHQGLWGIFEVFADTLFMCSITAFAILCSGVYNPAKTLSFLQKGSTLPDAMTGVGLTQSAFAWVLGSAGGIFICISIILFAFSTLIGWSYFGEQAFAYLTGGNRYSGLYKTVYLGAIVLGSCSSLGTVWQLADVFNAFMALPNLAALFALSPKVTKETRRFIKNKKQLHF